jgi:hypothetical protein
MRQSQSQVPIQGIRAGYITRETKPIADEPCCILEAGMPCVAQPTGCGHFGRYRTNTRRWTTCDRKTREVSDCCMRMVINVALVPIRDRIRQQVQFLMHFKLGPSSNFEVFSALGNPFHPFQILSRIYLKSTSLKALDFKLDSL